MPKNKIDKIRQKLKLDVLDEAKKKEMFEKFVQAGGRVVDYEEEEERALRQRRAREIDEKIAQARAGDSSSVVVRAKFWIRM